MDESQTLLIVIVAMIAVFSILMTGVRVVRPGEIGFVYRGRKFIRHTGPAIVIAPPIIGRIRRMKAKSLHAVVRPSSPRVEVQCGISDASIVPMMTREIDLEIRDRASEAVLKALSRRRDESSVADPGAIAEDIARELNVSLGKIGLNVVSVKVDELVLEKAFNEPSSVQILGWEEVSQRF